MSPKKLSEADKNEILRLYRHSPETTSTLATQYGVSSSTISRFLKNNLPEAEYEVLIQQKRSQSLATPATVAIDSPALESSFPIQLNRVDSSAATEISSPRQLEIDPAILVSSNEADLKERVEEFQQAAVEADIAAQFEEFRQPEVEADLEDLVEEFRQPEVEADLEDLVEEFKQPELPAKRVLPNLPSPHKPRLAVAPPELEDDEDNEDDDFDEDWEDDESDDDDSEAELLNLVPRHSDTSKMPEKVKILPLSAASLPKVCYLVVDRSAELIARPLRDFSDLGSIPESEIQEKTLPIFPNHRVAMRFSNRTQKVIKVPDSSILQKTSPQLQAKGITRLLANGQVYSLNGLDLDDDN